MSEPADVSDDGPVRKTVTVLFVDLVGSTAFQERVDPEAARGAMTRYYEMVQRVVDQHEGTVAKFQGDGALAVFGVPEVAEDDAVRAVATGVALQRAFSEIRSYVADRYGVEVGLRVGINTGEVVIADGDVDLVGDVLNTAARLEAACTPGEVMVGEDTWRLTRTTVSYEALGEVAVKGKAEPIAAFQVAASSESAAVDDAATPFVGREVELAALLEAYTAASDSQSAHMVTIIGAPGVGKTRLAAELVASREGARSFDVRCERAGTSTFAPIADLVRSVAGIDADQSGPDAEVSVAQWLEDVADADRLGPLLSSFVGGSQTFSTEELFFAARRLVELIASHTPAILVVDDIQWAEPLLLDLLEHLVEWVTGAPVLVIGLARPELHEIRPSLTEPGRRVHTVISLEGLDAHATAELAARLVGADRLPADLLARLPESTEGNPLFVRELMQMLVDDRVIARGPSGWALTIDAEAVDVPPTIQSLLSTRVERMPADERRLLELASVVGPDFARGAVATVVDGWSPAQIDDVIRRLERKELIEPTGGYWGNEPTYRFHHVLIRDAAYRRLLKGRRAELHLRVGEWTEQTASVLSGEHEVSIAHHFEQAHMYRRELGLDDDTTVVAGSKAAALLTVAAGRALARDDLSAAGSLALRAIACLAADAPELPSLLLTANEALFSAGDVARATPVLERLETYADDARLREWAVCFRGQLTVLADPAGLDVAVTQLDAAAVGLARLDDPAGVAKARQIRALALAALGRVGDCEAELDRALTAARKADDRRRVTAVLGAAPVAALWGPSSVPRAGGRCLDVIRLLRITTGSPTVEATSIRCQAVLEALRGRFDTARTMLGTARQTAEEVGLRQELNQTEFYAGLVELYAADPVAAEPHLRQAYQGLGRLGIGADAGQAAAHLARALLLQRRIDEAEELAHISDTLAGQNTQTAIAARSVRAEVLSARSRHDEAVALAEEAVSIAAGTDILVDHAQALAALARVRVAAGHSGEADRAALAARALFEQKGASVGLQVVGATLAASDSDRDELDSEFGRFGEVSGVGAGATIAADPSELAMSLPGRVYAGVRRCLNNADVEALRELWAPEIRVTSRRGGVSRADGDEDLDAMLEIMQEYVDAGMEVATDLPTALRGDRFAMATARLVSPDGAADHWLTVDSFDDNGRLVMSTMYDVGDFSLAMADLDQRYLASLGGVEQAVMTEVVELFDAVNHHDRERLRAAFPPGGSVVDRSHMSFPELDGEAFIERLLVPASQGAFMYLRSVPRLQGNTYLIEIVRRFPNGDETGRLQLQPDWQPGEPVRFEVYDPDQIDQALAAFDALTAPRDGDDLRDAALPIDDCQPAPQVGAGGDARNLASNAGVATVHRSQPNERLRNLATQTGDRVSALVRNGNVDDLLDWWRPDAVARDYSRFGGGAGTREDFVDAMRTWREVWDIGQPDAGGPIAIKGDHAALVEYRFGTVGSWSVDRLAMVVVDDEAKIADLTFYDHEDRDEALAALQDLDVAASTPEKPAAVSSARTSSGPTNRADRAAREHGVRFGESTWSVVETLGARLDDFALHRIVSQKGTTALALSCWTPSGEQVTAQQFTDDAVQKAFFELDEWVGDTLPAAIWRDSPVRAWAKATQEHDWDTARMLLHPDYEARVNQLLGPESMSGDALIRWFQSMSERSGRIVVATPEVHAASPIGTVQSEEFEEVDSEGYAVSNGGISANTFQDGRLARSVRFDDTELDDALTLLERAATAAGVGDEIVYLSEPARAIRQR